MSYMLNTNKQLRSKEAYITLINRIYMSFRTFESCTILIRNLEHAILPSLLALALNRANKSSFKKSPRG